MVHLIVILKLYNCTVIFHSEIGLCNVVHISILNKLNLRFSDSVKFLFQLFSFQSDKANNSFLSYALFTAAILSLNCRAVTDDPNDEDLIHSFQIESSSFSCTC